MITNYDRYFGTPAKTADSISRLVDYYDVSRKTGGEGETNRRMLKTQAKMKANNHA